MGKKKIKGINHNLISFNLPDVYTFVDASLCNNECSNSRIGVYGFVHFRRLTPFQTIQPFASGFKIARDCDIHELEARAMRKVIKSISKSFKHPRELEFCIVTDSDFVFQKLKAYFDGETGWMNKSGKAIKAMIECCELFDRKRHKQHNIILCKSHTKDSSEQFQYLKHNGMLGIQDRQYAKDIRIGNEYVDYCVTRMALHEDPGLLNYYNDYESRFDNVDDYEVCDE